MKKKKKPDEVPRPMLLQTTRLQSYLLHHPCCQHQLRPPHTRSLHIPTHHLSWHHPLSFLHTFQSSVLVTVSPICRCPTPLWLHSIPFPASYMVLMETFTVAKRPVSLLQVPQLRPRGPCWLNSTCPHIPSLFGEILFPIMHILCDEWNFVNNVVE